MPCDALSLPKGACRREPAEVQQRTNQPAVDSLIRLFVLEPPPTDQQINKEQRTNQKINKEQINNTFTYK
jgi:hypothetical protein